MEREQGRRRMRGATLVELMVGMLMGLLVTLVVAQTLMAAEGYKRSATYGSDAQANGALALFAIQRAGQASGYGMTAIGAALGCPIRARHGSTNFSWTLAPMQLVAGSAGAPDRVTMMASDKFNWAVPTRIAVTQPPSAANFFVETRLGIDDRDMMLAVPEVWDAANWCTMFQVASPPVPSGAGGHQVHHHHGGSAWNQAGGAHLFPAAGYPVGSYLVNLGSFVVHEFRVGAQGLERASFRTADASTTAETLFPDVVQLQAYYGKDSNGDGVVDSYDKATPTTGAGWLQVLTLRVAIVARSAKLEREVVTTANPQWDVGSAPAVSGAAACGASQCVTLKVDGLADWQRYRYRVFDTVVPLRNVIWRS